MHHHQQSFFSRNSIILVSRKAATTQPHRDKMDYAHKSKYVTRSRTQLCFDIADGKPNNRLPSTTDDRRIPNRRNPSMTVPSSVTVPGNKISVLRVRPATSELVSKFRSEVKDWYSKRKKKLLDRRRCWLKKKPMSNSNLRPPALETDPSMPPQVSFPVLNNIQISNEFHSLSIRAASTDGSSYLFVVPFVSMRDFLVNFKTGGFCQHVKGLMQVIPGNPGTSYYQFHWMTSKKEFADTKSHNWRDNSLLQDTTCYSLESMIHQIMDRLATQGDIVLETREECWEFYPSIVFTKGSASHQKPHLDFPMANLMRAGRVPYVLHLPLCKEGLALQIWRCWDETQPLEKISPRFIFVPFGSALLLRADVYHAGCYGSKGNLRLHAMIFPPDIPRETRSLQHLREGTNTGSHEIQDVDPLSLLTLLQSDDHQNTTAHYITLLEKSIVSPRFWVVKPLDNIIL
jgi:hypothetical protein